MTKDKITILDYQPQHQPVFEHLNRNWIERYFWLEPIDEFVLTQPAKAILETGGMILMISCNDNIAGTAALKKINDSTYEFTKMAVAQEFRGKGLGRTLSMAAIEKAKLSGAKRIILYSHTSLETAIHLYRKLGFKEILLEPGLYARSNIKMELSLDTITIISADRSHAPAIAAIPSINHHLKP